MMKIFVSCSLTDPKYLNQCMANSRHSVSIYRLNASARKKSFVFFFALFFLVLFKQYLFHLLPHEIFFDAVILLSGVFWR